MASTENKYVGNGSTVLYSFTFPYINQDDIYTTLDGVQTTEYTLANATTVEFNAAPASGVAIRIFRSTDVEEVPATFFPGSAIRAQDLNSNFEQTLYVAQELQGNTLLPDGSIPMGGNLNLGGFDVVNGGAQFNKTVGLANNRITNVAAPVDSTDAVNRAYVDNRTGGNTEIVSTSYVYYTATQGDTVLTSNVGGVPVFAMSEGLEQIYVNGALQQTNVDYTTQSSSQITFTQALLQDDVVAIHCINNVPFATTIDADQVKFTYPGGVQQTAQARLEQYLSVKDFGAVGDGVTDDTAAIQATFNAAASAGVICNVPQGTFMVTSLEMPSGLTIHGAGTPVTIFKQIADSVGPVLKSSYGSNLKMITLDDFYVDGNRANFTDPTIYNDGIYFEGGTDANNKSCIARAVHVERATGSGWHFGPSRQTLNLQYCVAKNCGSKVVGSDPIANSTGYGLRINSCADAYVGTGSGFGSNQNTSITIASSATPVVDSAEIWWAGTDTVDRPNIVFFRCPNFSCTNNNIDRARVAAVSVTGRVTTSDQPYHENGFISGNTFLFPYGSGGAGNDGDVDFIQLKDTSGILIEGNQFRANANDSGTDSRVVLVNYLVNALNSAVYDIAFTGNHWSTRAGGKPFVTAICNDYSIFSRLEASGTFTPQIKDSTFTLATTDSSSGAWFADGNTITYEIAFSNINTSGLILSEETRIYGLLAPNPLGTAFQTTGTVQFQQINLGTPALSYVASVEGGDNYISIRGIVDNANRTRIPLSELNSGTADIWLSISLPLHDPNGL